MPTHPEATLEKLFDFGHIYIIYIQRLIMMRCIFASINFSGLFLAFVQPNASLLGERQWQQQFDVVGMNFFQAKTICVAQKWNLYVDASLHTALLFKNALQSEQKLKHYLCIYVHSLEDPNNSVLNGPMYFLDTNVRYLRTYCMYVCQELGLIFLDL